MNPQVKLIEEKYKKKVPVIRPGDIVRVEHKIKESGKEKIQAFEGIVIGVKKPNELAYTITVRKVSFGIGVEKIFPVHAPAVGKIDVLKHSKVRRARLNYLRLLADKKTRAKLKSSEAKELSFIIPKEKEEEAKKEEAVARDEKKVEPVEEKSAEEVKPHEESPEVEEHLDEEVTELGHSHDAEKEHTSPEEDATKEVVVSTEELAKEENKQADEDASPDKEVKSDDEQLRDEQEFQGGVDKAENENSRDQEKQD